MFSSLAVTTPYLALAGVVVEPVPVMLFTVGSVAVVGVVAPALPGSVVGAVLPGVVVLPVVSCTLLISSISVTIQPITFRDSELT